MDLPAVINLGLRGKSLTHAGLKFMTNSNQEHMTPERSLLFVNIILFGFT